jgi:ABC-type branched-subunit amino acid transport system ATPase component
MSVEGLEARDIRVRFGGLVAVDGASIAATPGRITALIGPNGAGKTTTFNVCCGFQPSVGGNVSFDGQDISGLGPQQRARLGIGRTFQRMELFRSLTARENVELGAEASNITKGPLSQLGLRGGGRAVRNRTAEVSAELLERVGLTHVADRPAGALSTGQGRLIELARALARRPKILLLDEPSSGLDGVETAAFGEILVDLVRSENLGVLLVEHDMGLVLKISDWIEVLDFGRPLFAGTPMEVAASDAVRGAYLGRERVSTA